jgi:uncharacterized repeat protein (TIGR01451 family)
MSRRIRFGWLIAVALLATAPAGGQYPGQNIPPTRVPISEEPPLADPKTPGQLPDKVKQSIIGSQPVNPPGVTPIVPAANLSTDPPTPVVAIHVSAPASSSASGDVEYKIVAENKSAAAAHHVRVTFPKSNDYQVLRCDPPPANMEANPLAWERKTLSPNEKFEIHVVVLPKKEDTLEATARVQFEHGQKVSTVLHRPQIAIRKITNRHALENEPIACKLIVENTGAVDVSNITIDEMLDDGLRFDEKDKDKQFHKRWEIPLLRPKETQERTYTVTGTKAGTFSSKIEARGERGVRADSNWQITVGPSPVAIKITGPKQVYLNYPARYDIEVSYSATAPLDNVVVAVGLQKGMKVVRATPGAKSFENRLQWAIPKLSARETKFSVWAQAATTGTVPTFAEVLWNGPKQHTETTTEFLGAANLHLDIRESADPIRIGDKVRYTLTVTNRGTAAATDVKLVASFPTQQFAVDESGTDGTPSKALPGTQVIGPLSVPPKGTVTKTVTLKATAAGKAIFHVEMESAEHLPGGNVTREEPTTITD